jgi:hypothetical protein
MKSILITAAVLMTGASVYGLVDYNKKAQTREFKNLYREEKPAIKETRIESKEAAPVKFEPAPENTSVAVEKPVTRISVKKRNRLSLKSFSRAKLEKFEPPVQSH